MPEVIHLVTGLKTDFFLRVSNLLVFFIGFKIVEVETLDSDSLLGDDDLIFVDDVGIAFLVPEDLIASLDIKESLLFAFLQVPDDNAVIASVDLEDNSDDVGIASNSNVVNLNAFVIYRIVKLFLNVFLQLHIIGDVPDVLRVPEHAIVVVHFEVRSPQLAWCLVQFIGVARCVNKNVVAFLTLKVKEMLLDSREVFC